MSNIQRVRGTRDLMPADNILYRHVEETAYHLSQNFGYQEIDTPIFEFSEVFHRTLGETSDVVHKETYTFSDRGGDSITLRPEGTAGIARAFISEGLAQNLPLKFFYSGPMFRYERPQKGRYRQFHQIGVECLGLESAWSDVDVILLGWELLQKLGLSKKCTIEMNTLGDAASRAVYREQLVAYLNQYKNELSADSKMRLEKNPLRILDSKDPGDKKILESAPTLEKSLNDASKLFFDQVQMGVQKLGIPMNLNSKLVRGLDYYCHTVFEFVTSELGAQGTVLAGGRYDGLIEMMGGPKTPGVGWAAGIERLSDLIDKATLPAAKPIVALIPADTAGELESLKIAQTLRSQNYLTEIIWNGNVGKKMKKANNMGAAWALIIGESEVKSQSVTCKNMKTGEQKQISFSELSQVQL